MNRAKTVAPTANARHVALDVLDRVLGDQQPFDDSFAGHTRLPALAPRDRAFARLLITTVLRRLGQIDALLTHYLRQPPKTVRAQNLLRLGAAQLLFLHTPAHAAVAETVALATGRNRFAAGLANAVLRRMAREGEGLLAEQDAARLNLPDWLWQSWSGCYGEAATRAIAEVQCHEPPLDLTVKNDPKAWAERLDAVPLFGQTLRRRSGGLIDELPGYRDGAWWVQDAAAALPAALIGDINAADVIDLCAAPGGKTAQLCATGAKVTAVEISAKRAERLRDNLARLELAANIVVADARRWRPEQKVDHVLLDAPCTATGTIRRHPDIAWHKSAADVAGMADLQGQLLRAALDMLRPGGRLMYASCSLQPEEGPGVIESALAQDVSVARVPITAGELDGLPIDLTREGDLRTLPCHLAERGGMDGFFIARLCKQA